MSRRQKNRIPSPKPAFEHITSIQEGTSGISAGICALFARIATIFDLDYLVDFDSFEAKTGLCLWLRTS